MCSPWGCALGAWGGRHTPQKWDKLATPGEGLPALPANTTRLGRAALQTVGFYVHAITFSARRALAAGIRRSTCSAAEAAYLEPRDDQLAPDPARCFDCPVDPAPAAQ